MPPPHTTNYLLKILAGVYIPEWGKEKRFTCAFHEISQKLGQNINFLYYFSLKKQSFHPISNNFLIKDGFCAKKKGKEKVWHSQGGE